MHSPNNCGKREIIVIIENVTLPYLFHATKIFDLTKSYYFNILQLLKVIF